MTSALLYPRRSMVFEDQVIPARPKLDVVDNDVDAPCILRPARAQLRASPEDVTATKGWFT